MLARSQVLHASGDVSTPAQETVKAIVMDGVPAVAKVRVKLDVPAVLDNAQVDVHGVVLVVAPADVGQVVYISKT